MTGRRKLTGTWAMGRPPRRWERWTAAVLFFTATILMVVSWTGLMAAFDYPDILRQPPAEVLVRFLEGGPGLRLLWVGMTISALLLLPSEVLLSRAFTTDSAWSKIATVSGIASALVQAVGLIRWVFVVRR